MTLKVAINVSKGSHRSYWLTAHFRNKLAKARNIKMSVKNYSRKRQKQGPEKTGIEEPDQTSHSGANH